MEQKNNDWLKRSAETLYSEQKNGHRVEAAPNLVLHRSVLNDLPLIQSSLVVGGILAWFAIQNSSAMERVSGMSSLLLLTVALGALFAFVSMLVVFRRYNTRYLIAKDGVKAMRGILSNSQIEAKLEYYQIRGTEIRRSLFQRLINTGDLHVRGATSDDTEVSLTGVYNPYLYQKLIENQHRTEVESLKSTWVDYSGQTIRQDTHPQLM